MKGKKGDFTDFEHDMAVGVRRTGLSISESADPLEFSWLNHLTENGPKERKHPVTGKNALLMPYVREDWENWL